MQIQVTFRHVESSEAVKEYAQDKVGKLQKYLDGPLEASVTLTVEKHRHEADVNLIASGLKIHSRETTGDLFSSIDLATDKLEKQVRRYRDKLKDVGRRARSEAAEIPYTVEVLEAESLPEETPRVIMSQRLTAKPMNADEAAMQLDLSEDDFLVFINERTEALNVIYRRTDGNFGLIEPQ
ncbi:MAG: ribosome-associated translation inhibitor RaiA [Desulfarculaceae bacterium]|nr:ribosome-associated translation inhibitor RaiA [Desulfarculaceae bacterium]MCF8072320.1 ribosome-associated translation inhibitor RaiA [Desulfarculaceae bacterium]MCF8100241.1 ribosome-associated translation inhibitor RaiA [Desulfarculaceae bacterium]MCF8116186.1 ribosome-associated translation inhibitor RaiA [Desulfarculaceae bacterium]